MLDRQVLRIKERLVGHMFLPQEVVGVKYGPPFTKAHLQMTISMKRDAVDYSPK